MTSSFATLEFDKIIELLKSHTKTDGAKEVADNLRPYFDIEEVRRKLKETTDAKRLIGIKGYPPISDIRDIRQHLDRADKGAILTMREILDVGNVLRTSRALIDYIHSDRHGENVLDEIFSRLSKETSLENRIFRSIIAEDMMADDASPQLAEIRRKIRATNNRIKDTLQKYVTLNQYTKYLQENIVTTRNGRYVIPVRVECKNEIKGLVHDTSASGATVFIEPIAIVEANNELRLLDIEETKEIERILYEFSAEIAFISDVILRNYLNIVELDFIFAKGEFSYKLDATEPTVTEKRYIELNRSRHPLIDKNKVVPIDIRLGGDFDTLVITGPNTGGKTVSLKTLGLFALMAQAGMHIPCREDSTVCMFNAVFADIGDEQSIEQSLSTFSSHMTNIVKILNNLQPNSLVLFDELGAGTDPIEGAALAIAILEKVRETGALCAATTHYAELKAYALETKGVCNASCEFDVETLKPTYKLIIGTPGKSNAFAISERLGLDKAIVERAKHFVASDNKRFENVIEQLEAARIQMERNKEETARLKREFEKYKIEAEEKIRKREAEAEKALERAKAEAISIVKGAKVTSDYVLEQLEEVKRKQKTVQLAEELEKARREIRKSLSEMDDKINPVIQNEAPKDYVLPRPLKKGDEVKIININKTGFLEDDPDKDGNVVVRAGIISTRTNIKNLMLIEGETTFISKEGKKINTGEFKESVARSFSPELDIRGKTGEEGWLITDKYLDDAVLAGVPFVRIIHGKGTGSLRRYLWERFKNDSRIKSFRIGVFGEGDSGVTVIEMKK